jgi:lipopolysaccharide transport system permease protein
MDRPRLHVPLIRQLIYRDVAGRYRGSVLGLLWSLLTPLFMLGLYTFVFGSIVAVRWQEAGSPQSTAEFAVVLFAGLIVFQLFSEVVTRAPLLILANVTYVKKVVFPLQVLPVVAVGSALFHAGVSFAVLALIMLASSHGVPATAFLLPLVIAPFAVLTLGLCWFLASLGVYLRDIGQFIGTFMSGLMFLSPLFFPLVALPAWLRGWVMLNPISVPIEQTRRVLIWGDMPDWVGLALYLAVASAIAVSGYAWFQKTRKGFADVL